MALHRCLVCGHTDDFTLTDFVCPSCDTQLELLPGEMSMTTIALCTLKGGNYNHAWRFVTARLVGTVDPNSARALWQCDDCHRITEGRCITPDEAVKLDKGEMVYVASVEAP